MRIMHEIWAFLTGGFTAHCPSCHTVFYEHEGITHQVVVGTTHYRYICKKCERRLLG